MSRELRVSPFEKLPMEMLLYQAKWLNFDDFRNYIRARWPNNNEPEIIQETLWKKSLHRTKAMFLNEKILDIEYSFDNSRGEEDKLLINMSSLVSLFGKNTSEELNGYMSLSEIAEFIKKDVPLNMCSSGRFASCICHLPEDVEDPPESSEDECQYKHFHHYCLQHVKLWFENVLIQSIEGEQSGNPLDEDECYYWAALGRLMTFPGTGDEQQLSQLHSNMKIVFNEIAISRRSSD